MKKVNYRHFSSMRLVLTSLLLPFFLELISRALLLFYPLILYTADSTYEYSASPNQKNFSFRGDFSVNKLGIRGPNIQDLPSTSRIIIFGDSIIFGGVHVPYQHLATTYLGGNLTASGVTPEVINVSAGSWGPGNWLGWAQTHGFLRSNRLLLVLSSHDAKDVPLFLEKSNTCIHPEEIPLSVFYFFLKCKLASGVGLFPTYNSPSSGHDSTSNAAIRDLRAFLLFAKSFGIEVHVLQFLSLNELETGFKDNGYFKINSLLKSLGVPHRDTSQDFVQCARYYQTDLKSLFVDDLHPFSNNGQKCLAYSMKQLLRP